jgi:hypothetical protein
MKRHVRMTYKQVILLHLKGATPIALTRVIPNDPITIDIHYLNHVPKTNIDMRQSL